MQWFYRKNLIKKGLVPAWVTADPLIETLLSQTENDDVSLTQKMVKIKSCARNMLLQTPESFHKHTEVLTHLTHNGIITVTIYSITRSDVRSSCAVLGASSCAGSDAYLIHANRDMQHTNISRVR